MNEYELKVYDEVETWKRRMMGRSGMLKRLSKKTQGKVNEWIPEKVHELMTNSIKAMVKATLFGSQITTSHNDLRGITLEEKDATVRKKITSFQKTAMVEGAGTGAGGLLLGFADFPLLLSIKMKFLFETAEIYGFHTKEYEERLFILHVFQLAFSSDEIRKQTLSEIENWEDRKQDLMEMDWRKFQQEYRDYLDLAKMFQLVPGIGAFVGAYANHNLLKTLGETAMNAYRLRILTKTPEL
ncbi:EcsC family protein [Bacillus sp. BRMEA1]|uniref:EcsC family protein n=1 Tax=Neobacillus endophyticus TaxID=2738405 RepID=UPI001566E9DA|nr:EcsC family protein [Neobacillus endophyticus]NRD78368.1 EcsC family protein [Neobacillus endophyticus]